MFPWTQGSCFGSTSESEHCIPAPMGWGHRQPRRRALKYWSVKVKKTKQRCSGALLVPPGSGNSGIWCWGPKQWGETRGCGGGRAALCAVSGAEPSAAVCGPSAPRWGCRRPPVCAERAKISTEKTEMDFRGRGRCVERQRPLPRPSTRGGSPPSAPRSPPAAAHRHPRAKRPQPNPPPRTSQPRGVMGQRSTAPQHSADPSPALTQRCSPTPSPPNPERWG